jgi:N-acetyl-gamma-glutamyl-phosphate/LysW-gamma-L-alpha-aminoadipyl-6-phosphate reductase
MTTRVSILGATGYGGGELLRLLLSHPEVQVVHATSRSQAGLPVGRVHRNLLGLTDLEFSAPSFDEVAANTDVVIGALPHGASAQTLGAYVDAGLRVIDLSGDFRLRDADTYRTWYKAEHPRPDLLPRAVYGCPEAYRDAIATAQLVASPGCFATAINLALLPMAAELDGRVTVVGMTGSSGSGADPAEGTHHPTRAATLRPYKVLSHQHGGEVLQLAAAQGAQGMSLEFTPVSAPLVRGILVVAHASLRSAATTASVERQFREFFAGHPFVKVLTTREPECAPIAGTNFAEVRARVSADGRLHVTCAIDNLVKGGAGQAVQSLNLMLGVSERCGLEWAGTWP